MNSALLEFSGAKQNVLRYFENVTYMSTVLHYRPSLKEVKGGTQTGQEPEDRSWQRLWRSADYLLVLHGLLRLLSYSTQDHQHRNDTTHNWLSPPTEITKKRLDLPSPSPILWRHFLSWSSLLSDDASLFHKIGRKIMYKRKGLLTFQLFIPSFRVCSVISWICASMLICWDCDWSDHLLHLSTGHKKSVDTRFWKIWAR